MYIKGGNPMIFEWDEHKNRTNKRKHGISFERVLGIWKDPKRIVLYDEYHSIEEERWNVIGCAGFVLFVVYVEKGDGCIRLISARKANNEEVKRYYRDYDLR